MSLVIKFLIIFAFVVATATAQVSNEYLPPFAGGSEGSAVAASAPAPEVIYAAPSSDVESYDTSASAPAHTFSSDEGYRYKTHRRRVYRRHRRGVSTEYLPPAASAPAASYAAEETSYSSPAGSYSGSAASYSAPAASYSAPAASYSAPAASYSAPAASYSAPAASYSESYDTGASAPAHSYSSDEGYRYKTQRRRVFRTSRRHRRGVSTEYLPPAASAPAASYAAEETSYSSPAGSYSGSAASYSAPAVSYSAPAASYSAPAASYSAPAASYSESYDTGASAPAHSYSSDEGYPEYLPPLASNSVASYSAPEASYSEASYSAPAASYESYDTGAASSPSHSFSDADGYRYKTQRRRVFRRHR
ncbi:uncharacterized protein LOC131997630 [Stomoxys calcitrans]|uniref:uncharacterized protein LOC131997630 n=1 Tax=Stomoxys calcitrans TaxID=35570 RepID=UPI0027E23293|nr:uncharacterized protein LOC131997630 [Stomoxys calcitrans]